MGLDDLKPQLLEMGICEVLIPLTNSPSVEVQGNSAAALGNLSSKGQLASFAFGMNLLTPTPAAEDYAPFNAVWNKPDGGLHAYLVRFLSSADITFQHIAVWVSSNFGSNNVLADMVQTIVQLLEAEDDQLTANIRSSSILIASIRQLASSPPPSRGGAGGRGQDGSGGSDEEFEDDGMDTDGEGEIASLARRILDLTEEGAGRGGQGDPRFTGRNGAGGAGSGAGGAVAGGSEDTAQVGSQGSDHAALRASVHRALSGN